MARSKITQFPGEWPRAPLVDEDIADQIVTMVNEHAGALDTLEAEGGVNTVTGTGTANTVPKFTGAHVVGNSTITDDGTNVTAGNNGVTRLIGTQIQLSANGVDSYFGYGGTDTYIRSGTAGSKVYIGDANTGGVVIGATTNPTSVLGSVGFYGTTPIAKQTVTGSRAAGAAWASLLAAMVALGLVTDGTSA